MSSTDPTPISLIFAPDFGCPHYDKAEGDTAYWIERNLAGAVRVFHPVGRKTFEIGRHHSCWIQIGKHADLDSFGENPFNTFSRVHVSFVWFNVNHEHGVATPGWYIVSGGLFLDDQTGEQVICKPRNETYLNGRRLDYNDPEPLFPNGKDMARVCLGLTGKIILENRDIGQHSTGWPRDVWFGEGWPNPDQVKKRRGDTDPGLRDRADQQIAEDKSQQQSAPKPWYVDSVMAPAWAWFIAKPFWAQFLILIVAGVVLVALLHVWRQ